MTLKVPISRQLTGHLTIPLAAVVLIPVADLFKKQQLDTMTGLLLLLIIPLTLLIWALVDSRTEFREIKKVRSSARLVRLPFSSDNCLFIFIISSFPIFGGLGMILTKHNLSEGLVLAGLGMLVFAATAFAVDHPKIWFADTSNLEEDIERINNTPKEAYPMYQDGIFKYNASGFSVKIEETVMNVTWDEIQLVHAYKIDQFAVDCIVIEVHLDKTFFKINDQTPGHMKFMDLAEENLTGFRKDWFHTVAFPPFAENFTVVYNKSDILPSKGSN